MKFCNFRSSFAIIACVALTVVAAVKECREGVCLNKFNKHLVEISLIRNSKLYKRDPIKIIISYYEASTIVRIKTTCTDKIVQNFPINVEYFNISVLDARFSFNHINGSRPGFFKKQFYIDHKPHNAVFRSIKYLWVSSNFVIACLVVSYWLLLKGTASRVTKLKTHNILKVVRQHAHTAYKDRCIVLNHNFNISANEFRHVMHDKSFYRDNSDLMILATQVVRDDN